MKRQLQIRIPLENIRLVNEDIDVEFQVVKIYLEDSRDLVHFVVQAGNENTERMFVDVPAGQERPQMSQYGDAGLKFKVIDHGEVS